MKKDFFDWFAKAKTRNKVLSDKAFAEENGQSFVAPDVYDFDAIEGDKVGGTTTKAFVMLRGEYMSELYNEVHTKSQSNYVTCVDDYIKDATWEEFKDFPVSIIGKQARHNAPKFNMSELIYSRLANIFGLKTSYVFSLSDDYQIIASVDVLKVVSDKNGKINDAENRIQQMESFNDLTGGRVGTKSPIEYWFHYLDRTFSQNKKEWGLTNEQIDGIAYDLIKVYMIRRFIFQDNDLHGENISFIHSKDYSDLQLAPAIDMEFCGDNKKIFDRQFTPEEYEQFKMENIAFLIEKYPHHLSRLMSEISEVKTNKMGDIEGVYQKYAPNESYALCWTRQLVKNINELDSAIELCKGHSM